MSDPEPHVSPYLTMTLRALADVCHDEGRRARRMGADIDDCAYTYADLREPWEMGWREANDEIDEKEDDDEDETPCPDRTRTRRQGRRRRAHARTG